MAMKEQLQRSQGRILMLTSSNSMLGDCDAARTEHVKSIRRTFRLLREHKSVLTYMRFTATVENALEATDVRGMLLKGGFLSLVTESFLLLPFRIRNKSGKKGKA